MSLVPAKCNQTRVKMPPLFSEVASKGEDVSERKAFVHTGFFPWRFDGNGRVKHTGWMPQTFFFSLPTTTQLCLAAKMHTHSILETSFLASMAKSSLR